MTLPAGGCAAAIVFLALSAACGHAPPMTAVPPPVSSCRMPPAPAARLRWMAPANPRDREALDRWCATVGPVVVRTSSAAPARAGVAVAVISWNTHVGGGSLDRFIALLQRGELTEGRRVDAFVLLLQEVFGSTRPMPALGPDAPVPEAIVEYPPDGERQSIEAVARALDLSLLYVPSMRNGRRSEDRGNAILSNLPLEDPAAIELPLERQRRVAVAATIVLPDADGTLHRLRVATAHFDTSVRVSRGGPVAARRRQATALVEALAADAAVIAAGDFNTWFGREPALDILREALPDIPPAETTTWRGGIALRATLDHMFARLPGAPRLRVTRVSRRFGSDHHPLLAVLPAASVTSSPNVNDER